MDKQITEHVIKISGKATLLQPIDLSHNYKVQIDGSVVEVADVDNEDGTFTRYYKYKPALVTVIDELGTMIKAKDIRSRSKQMRVALWKKWEAKKEAIDFETYYDRQMLELIKQVIEN